MALDTYIRISRVGARAGDEYRTPHIQRDEINRWLEREGIERGKEVVEEDVSGGTAVKDRGLDELIRRAERGESGGVITYRLNRFGRDHLENLLAVKRLPDAEARLVCVADGVDSDQSQGKWLLNMMSLQAEDELERVKANWKAATAGAVADGIHIACRAPIGYLRRDQVEPHYDAKGKLVRDGRLVEDPATADAIRQAFVLRASGTSYGNITKTLPRRIGKSTLAGIFKNPVYLGQARGPNDAVKEGAHPALTTPALFRAVQPGKKNAPTGLASGALLGGLITCAGCGHKLRVMGSTGSNGVRRPCYSCALHFQDRDCPAPASGLVSLVDAEVVKQLANGWEKVETGIMDAESAWLAAKDALQMADAALDDWVSDPTFQQMLSKKRFQTGIIERQSAVEAAQQTLWDMPDPGIGEDKPIVVLDGRPMVYEAWGEDVAADRRTLRRYLESVTLTKADPARRRWQPITERLDVRWRGAAAPVSAS